MNLLRNLVHVAMVACFAVFFSCTKSPVAGGGSDLPDSKIIAGVVYSSEGVPAVKTVVTLYPQDYNPQALLHTIDLQKDTTDNGGRYKLVVPDSNAIYSVMAVSLQKNNKAYVSGIVVKGDTTSVKNVCLTATGSVTVMLPDSLDYFQGYLYIPGTDISVRLSESKKTATLLDVPSGIVSSVNYYTLATSTDVLFRNNVKIYSDKSTFVFNTRWKYMRELQLNTAASGANVLGTVTNFPVLVRLTSANFEFGQAQTSGADIMFTKADNTPLLFEIERFDPVSKLAEVWVNVDTVFGNDSSQFIQMYWGTQANAALSLAKCLAPRVLSNSNRVFDTANGFAGTWHLDNNCNDATPARRDGTNFGAIDTEGIIGNCKKFGGSDSIKIEGLMGNLLHLTLSVWVRLDTVNFSSGAEVLSIGNTVLIRMDDNYENKGTHGDFKVLGDTSYDYTATGRFLAKTGWHNLVYTYNYTTAQQFMFIDGELSVSHANVKPIDYTKEGNATYIGVHGNGEKKHNFSGLIDEVRVDNVARSADWVKLGYMNQQALNRLVFFK